MKYVISILAIAFLTTSCVSAGKNIQHVDSPGQAQSTHGTELCNDGNLPPCTIRK